MSVKKDIDWESIEKDWRAGIKTKLQMSEEYKVSRAAMDKRFEKLGITRNLADKIRQRAEALVTQKVVTQQVTSDRLIATERDIVEANATMQADITIGQHKGLQVTHGLVEKFYAELESTGDNVENLRRLGELLIDTTDDADTAQAKRLDTLNKVLALPSRVDTFKKLVDSQKSLITMQREVYGLVDKKPTAKSLEDFLDELNVKPS